MLETLFAAWIPVSVGLLIAVRFGDRNVRNAYLILAIVTLVWTSPCWMFGRSPGSFEYLFNEVAPWQLPANEISASRRALLSDVPLQFVPWRTIVADSFSHGEIPFLNRFAGSGTPLLENPQAAPFAPATLLGLPFSSFAWPLFAGVLRLLLATTGMYLFLRQERLHETASITGAIAWGFCAFNVAFLEFPHINVTSLLPWLLIAIRLVVSGRWESGVLGAGCVALMIAGGHPESVLHVACLAIPFAGWLVWSQPRRTSSLTGIALIGVLGAGLAAPLVIPFVTYLPLSERMSWLDRTVVGAETEGGVSEAVVPFIFAGHYLHTTTAKWPGFEFNEVATQYSGLATLLLAGIGIKARRSRMRFWIAAFAILFLLALFGSREALRGVPILGWTAHVRLRFVLAFIVSVVAAHGLDHLLTETIERSTRVAATLGAAILAATIALISLQNVALYTLYRTTPHVFVSALAALTSLAAVLFVVWRPGPRIRFAIPLLVAVDLFVLLGFFNPPMSRKYFYPETPAIAALTPGLAATRVLGIWNAMFPNTGAMFGVELVTAHDPVAFEPYLRLLERAGYDRRSYFNAFRRLPPRSLIDFIGAGHVIAPVGFPAPGLVRVHEGRDAWVYRNPSALPRFFVPARVVTAADPADELLRSNDARVVFVLGESSPVSEARVQVVNYRASSARLEIESAGDSFIASSEVALPGWSLELDGEAWPLEVINGTFLGWRVPAGRHTATLVYRPERWELSVALFAASIAVALLLVARLLSPQRRNVVTAAT